MKENKGITLVALVIIVVAVIIVLAAVSINLILTDNEKETQAKENTQIATNNEQSLLPNSNNEINNLGLPEETNPEETNPEGTDPEGTDPEGTDPEGTNPEGTDPEGSNKPTLASQITSANYGDKVNYSVTLNKGKENEITLGDGKNEDGTTNELDCWKIFYNDQATNKVIIKYGDYLPNATNLAQNAGLTQGTGDYEKYAVYSNTSRKDLIDKLNDSTKWAGLLNGNNVDLKTKAIAKGAVDLEIWVKSWNEKYNTKIYTGLKTGMRDGIDGYYIGANEKPTNFYQYVNNDVGYNDKLYFPYQSQQSNCYGYGIASPAASLTNSVIYVDCNGAVRSDEYGCGYYGVCPAVYLTSNVLTGGKDASGAWVIE